MSDLELPCFGFFCTVHISCFLSPVIQKKLTKNISSGGQLIRICFKSKKYMNKSTNKQINQ